MRAARRCGSRSWRTVSSHPPVAYLGWNRRSAGGSALRGGRFHRRPAAHRPHPRTWRADAKKGEKGEFAATRYGSSTTRKPVSELATVDSPVERGIEGVTGRPKSVPT